MNVKDIQPKSAANVTPEIIAAWKKAYGEISELTVLADTFKMVPQGENKPEKKEYDILYKGWIRKPTRNEMREFTSLQTDPITYTERVLATLFLGGDEELITNDEAFYSIMPEVQKVLEIKTAEIKKL